MNPAPDCPLQNHLTLYFVLPIVWEIESDEEVKIVLHPEIACWDHVFPVLSIILPTAAAIYTGVTVGSSAEVGILVPVGINVKVGVLVVDGISVKDGFGVGEFVTLGKTNCILSDIGGKVGKEIRYGEGVALGEIVLDGIIVGV
jgi:hypothetical protein